MNNALISLGSNVPYGDQNILEAIKQIQKQVFSAKFSSIYESEPIGSHLHAMYNNCVGQIYTHKSADELEVFFKNLERTMGRNEETRKSGNVPLDIDLVIWNGEVRRPNDLAAEYLREGLDQLGHT